MIGKAQQLTFPDSLIPLYIAFLAWDEFAATHDKDGLGGAPQVPGETDQDTDTEKLVGIAFKIANDLVKEANAKPDDDELDAAKAQIREFASELYVTSPFALSNFSSLRRMSAHMLHSVRAGGAELHNIGALAGGIVSQEVIKVITEQYVPVDDTCVFDGIRSKSMVFKV